jgi:Fic family protein
VFSSRIEGTQVTIGQVLRFEAGATPASEAKQDDIREVLNLRAALREGTKLMKTLPLSQRVVRKAYEVLRHQVRGA